MGIAEAGEHAALAPVNNDVQAAQIANAYLDDTVDVAEAKAAFDAEFKSVAAGVLLPNKPLPQSMRLLSPLRSLLFLLLLQLLMLMPSLPTTMSTLRSTPTSFPTMLLTPMLLSTMPTTHTHTDSTTPWLCPLLPPSRTWNRLTKESKQDPKSNKNMRRCFELPLIVTVAKK